MRVALIKAAPKGKNHIVTYPGAKTRYYKETTGLQNYYAVWCGRVINITDWKRQAVDSTTGQLSDKTECKNCLKWARYHEAEAGEIPDPY